MTRHEATEHRSFQHTHISVYILYPIALACIFFDSTQGILQKYELNRKWYYLWGTTCFFAYLYLRPILSKGLGSASSGYVNPYSVYICWLCGTVFLHLPSLESMGFDVKADVSVLLTTFLMSMVVLGLLHAVHSAAVMCQLLSPALYNPIAGKHGMTSICLLNSFNLAIACSTYYGFCGNAGTHGEGGAGPGGTFKAAICQRWLHPIGMSEHPMFARWAIYGEGAISGVDTSATDLQSSLAVDARNFMGKPTNDTISPVFTLWVTLVLMYLVNSLADYSAAGALQAGCTADVRKGLLQSARSSLRRTRSAEWQSEGRALSSLPSRAFEMMQRSQSGQVATHVTSLMRSMSRGLPSLTRISPNPLLETPHPDSQLPPGPRPVRIAVEAELGSAGADEQPDFMPMFPWYSGTSADMYKTMVDLTISVKLFLGRFDMRTMQAATAATPPGAGRDPPREGDGFTFEHLAERDSLWMDFTADTGDGGDPTYAVAAAMATPLLHITVPEGLAQQQHRMAGLQATPRMPGSPSSDSSSGLDSPGPASHAGAARIPPPSPGARLLPRADVLVIGGDLAYPNPSNETYETRFFRPYEAALPSPAHAKPGALVIQKPDLPSVRRRRKAACRCPASTHCAAHTAPSRAGTECRVCEAVQALRRYDGPSCFAIPGNHDWIDGLETFTRHIQHRGWLGGWLLPQENSYFALHLPHGWWLFGLDLALLDDIDLCQCRYFARIADERMGPDDAVILVTHQPRWLMDWFWEEPACHNLRQLVRNHLRGRARVHLAGDLHFYMRHSFCPAPPSQTADAFTAGFDLASRQPFGTAHQARPGASSSKHGRGSKQTSHAASEHPPVIRETVHDSAASADGGDLSRASSAERQSLCSTAAQPERAQQAGSIVSSQSNLSPSPSVMSLDEEAYATDSGFVARGSHAAQASMPGRHTNYHPADPEHLIVNGLGGAFLHPTHVFASARFGSVPEATPDMEFTRGSSPRGRPPEPGVRARGVSPQGHSPPRGVSPPRRRLSRKNLAVDIGVGKIEDGGANVPGGGGEFRCAAAYPSAKTSLSLGRLNLHGFRLKNTRFDIIGGALYFMLTVSVLPRCGRVAAVLDASSLAAAAAAFADASLETAVAILTESYLSLAALVFLVLMTFGFARAGGVGAVPTHPAPSTVARTESMWTALAHRGRTGGLQTQLVFGFMHAFTHFAAAVLLMVLLELGVETCIKYESLGAEGYHSLFSWYQRFEAQHFPDPMGIRDTITRWTGHLYPSVLKFSFAVFDVPEAIAVSRTALCSAHALTRLQAAAYYGGMLAFYWIIATPPVGFLFGCYLYIAVNWFGVHYDEAFSALRIPHFKGFSRLHISPSGDLHIYTLAMDKVPAEWKEDPRWRGRSGAGSRKCPAHAAEVPSRWIPVHRHVPATDEHFPNPSDSEIRLVDYLRVPKQRTYT